MTRREIIHSLITAPLAWLLGRWWPWKRRVTVEIGLRDEMTPGLLRVKDQALAAFGPEMFPDTSKLKPGTMGTYYSTKYQGKIGPDDVLCTVRTEPPEGE